MSCMEQKVVGTRVESLTGYVSQKLVEMCRIELGECHATTLHHASDEESSPTTIVDEQRAAI